MNKYVTELIGTFFLIFTVGCAAGIGYGGSMAPLAIGAVLMVMVFAGGHISGAHYNPAITLGLWIRGKCLTRDVVPYWIAQLIAAALAALAVNYLRGAIPAVAMPINLRIPQVLLVEFLFTFALVYVVLNVATAKGTANNSFYGLAIGFTVTAGAFAVGGISGGVFNPAVALGITIMGLSTWANIWMYLLANFAAGLIAALVFCQLNRSELNAETIPQEPAAKK
ncbi:MAG TPA: aquaporin [Tepidisphaeraceae bacterium]|jgi:aquaporin Z